MNPQRNSGRNRGAQVSAASPPAVQAAQRGFSARDLFALVFGTEAAASGLLGMMLAILHYEWVHYVAHIPYQPRTRLLQGS